MFSIKNVSTEPLRVDVILDRRDPNQRVAGLPSPEFLDPNQELSLVGYEPGTLLRVQPISLPAQPRLLEVTPKPARIAVVEELLDLDRRRGRYQAIINSSKAFQYSDAHKQLLQDQLVHMAEYARHLQLRIQLLDAETSVRVAAPSA